MCAAAAVPLPLRDAAPCSGIPHYTRQSAFHDRRFSALKADEVPQLTIALSVLHDFELCMSVLHDFELCTRAPPVGSILCCVALTCYLVCRVI